MVEWSIAIASVLILQQKNRELEHGKKIVAYMREDKVFPHNLTLS